MSKNLTQLTEKTVLSNDDLFHIVRSNVDYKVKYSNLIGSSVGLISITYAAAQTLISTLSLVVGRFYLITDKADAGIILQATSTSSFSIKGDAFYFVGDYQNVGLQTGNMKGVWHSGLSALTANISIAIYNGLHYRNLTGNVGTAPDGDAVNWVVLAKTLANGYILDQDIITYDFASDTIVWREDKYGNKISQSSISTWQWGEDAVYGNIVTGIQGGVTIINQRGNITGNIFHDCVVTIGNSSRGTINGSLFKTGPFDELVCSLDQNKTIKGCTFNFIDTTTTLSPSADYRGVTLDFDTEYSRPSNGDTYTLSPTTKKYVFEPVGGTIAGFDIVLDDTDESLYDGKEVLLVCNGVVTTLGISAGSKTVVNAPTTITNTGVKFVYILSEDKYYKA